MYCMTFFWPCQQGLEGFLCYGSARTPNHLPRLALWRGHSNLTGWERIKHKAAVICYKSRFNWHRNRTHTWLFQWWEGPLHSHGSATTCLKLSSPKKIGCWPTMICCFSGCLELGVLTGQAVHKMCTEKKAMKDLIKNTSSLYHSLECKNYAHQSEWRSASS